MKKSITKQFVKDSYLIPLHRRKLSEMMFLVENANTLKEIPNCEKMKGHKNYYRIRIGNYRIGLELDGEVIIFKRFLHRRDIYKYFPGK